jgi:uncharacterized membrane protein YphA (DoxX/SURF4 family)
MRSFASVFACLAVVGYARRKQTAIDMTTGDAVPDASHERKQDASKPLQTLLLALNPVAPRKFRSMPTHTGHLHRLPESRMQVPKEQDEGLIVSDDVQETITEVAFFLMKCAVAAVMVHHGQEKILKPNSFTKWTIDAYFGFLPGPHIFYTYAAGWIQFLAPYFMVLGVFSRVAAASLVAVMAGAFFHSMLTSGLEGFPFFELGGLGATMSSTVPAFHNYAFETPTLYIVICLLIAVNGPGKFSIAQLLGWNDDKSLLGKLKQ